MENFRKGKNKLSWTAIFTKEGRAEMRRRKALKEEEEWNECLETCRKYSTEYRDQLSAVLNMKYEDENQDNTKNENSDKEV